MGALTDVKLSDLSNKLRMSDRIQEGGFPSRRQVEEVASMLPVVGSPLSAHLAAEDFNNKDYFSGALNTIGAVSGLPIAKIAASIGVPLAALGGLSKAAKLRGVTTSPSTLAQLMPKQRGVFVGEKSALHDVSKADEAKKLLASGISPSEVYAKTGYGVSPIDQKVFSEVSDAPSYIKTNAPLSRIKTTDGNLEFIDTSLGEGFDHPTLYKAYPGLRDAGYKFFRSPEGHGGKYVGGSGDEFGAISVTQPDYVWSGVNKPENRQTTVHEINHAISGLEQFPSGTTVDSELRKLVNKDTSIDKHLAVVEEANIYNNLIRDLGLPTDVRIPLKIRGTQAADLDVEHIFDAIDRSGLDDNIKSKLKDQLERVDFAIQDRNPRSVESYIPEAERNYLSNAGEANSRLAEYRSNLSPDELRSQYPYDPEYFEKATGVPLQQVIDAYNVK